MTMTAGTLLPTSLVGSYPQPDWLLDRENLRARFPPRVYRSSCAMRRFVQHARAGPTFATTQLRWACPPQPLVSRSLLAKA